MTASPLAFPRPGGAIVGAGTAAVERPAHTSLPRLAIASVEAALACAEMTLGDIDGVVSIPFSPSPSARQSDGYDVLSARYIASLLALGDVNFRLDLGPSEMMIDMVRIGCHVLAAGACRTLLLVRPMWAGERGGYAQRRAEVAVGFDQFLGPLGVGTTGPVRHAAEFSRFLHERGLARADVYPVIRNARQNAQANPLAYWRDAPVPTLSEYLDQPSPFAPLSILDCDIPVSGVTAVVMTPVDRARDTPHPAFIRSLTSGAAHEHLFEAAGISPSEVRVHQLYDGYSDLLIGWLEALGLADADNLGGVLDPRNVADDRPRVNTFGGSLGEGRLHGGGHLREAVMQVAGRAGDRQVPGVEYATATNGFPSNGSAILLGVEPGD